MWYMYGSAVELRSAQKIEERPVVGKLSAYAPMKASKCSPCVCKDQLTEKILPKHQPPPPKPKKKLNPDTKVKKQTQGVGSLGTK